MEIPHTRRPSFRLYLTAEVRLESCTRINDRAFVTSFSTIFALLRETMRPRRVLPSMTQRHNRLTRHLLFVPIHQ